ncbi:MAG TPA: serine hydrolase [Clostridium sp.]|nr:serine hydrolase [Clostridium sp.]
MRNKKAIISVIVSVILAMLLSIQLIDTKSGDYIDSLIDKYKPVGASVAIIKDGQVKEVRNYGYANLSDKSIVDNNTQFKIASISKSITSYAVMQLVDEGKVDLDEPVNTYLKKWKVPKGSFDENKVTLRTLMSHTSGLTGSDEIGYSYPLPTIDEALKTRDIKLKREPGESFEYSEFTGLGVCQLVIEEVTGEKFEDYMVNKFFKRLNMNNTNYSNDNKNNNFAVPYAGFNKPVEITPIVMNGAGGVSTTSSDLGKYAAELINYYNNGNKEMFRAQNNTESTGGKYALGIIPRELKNGKTVYEHNGTLTGWNAQLAIEPYRKSGIVIVTNSDKAFYLTYELMEKWSEYEIGEKVVDTQIAVISNMVYKGIIIISAICLICLSVFFLKIKKEKLIKISGKMMHRRCIARAVFIILLAALYYIILYTDIPFNLFYNMSNYYLFTFFPPCYAWINILLAILAVFIIVRGAYIKNKSK